MNFNDIRNRQRILFGKEMQEEMTNQEIVNNLKGLLEEDVNKTLADIPMDYLWAVAKAIDVIGADVKPIVRGNWVPIDDEPHEVWECDRCGFIIEYEEQYNFCPNCGADMRKE